MNNGGETKKLRWKRGAPLRLSFFVFHFSYLTGLLLAMAPVGWAGDYDSLLAVQRKRAGSRATELFCILDQQDRSPPVFMPEYDRLPPEQRQDLEFLLAYLPLGDFAISPWDLQGNMRNAREARNQFPWGKTCDESIYRHFVLPHRISQEPYTNWRPTFIKELAPRLQNLSMSDAALEVNQWCREKATYKPTDGRDQDPLTTIRAGFGRCEEEMILAIAALRSVGIPARQCYTPYWAHTDDNHAWVEVWVDGKWHYFGACEPEPALNQAWFTGAAARAMLVVSSVYGDYHGDEPVLKRYGRSTLINSTAVYGPTKEVVVTLLNPKGKPVPNQRVFFSLFNYGALMPATALKTDSAGVCRLVSGIGDWFISSGDEKVFGLARLPANQDTFALQLAKYSKLSDSMDFDYAPPGAKVSTSATVASPESAARGLEVCPMPSAIVPMDSLFRRRLQIADSVREAQIALSIMSVDSALTTFGIRIKNGVPAPYSYNPDSARIRTLLRNARRNSQNVAKFLEEINFNFPPHPDPFGAKVVEPWYRPEYQLKLMTLETLTEKDLRDFDADSLSRGEFVQINADKQWYIILDSLEHLDSASLERFKDHILCPRIDYEPSIGAITQISELLQANPKLASSPQDERLVEWLRDSITVETDPDRLGPPLTPEGCLELRRGTESDIERLYIALCRVRNIPARRNPVTDRVERWDSDHWTEVNVLPEKGKSAKPAKPGRLVLECQSGDTIAAKALYLKDWSVEPCNDGVLSPVDFGYHKPFSEVSWPQELPPGRYALVTGLRREDGSAPVKLHWFALKSGKDQRITIDFRGR